MNKRISTIAAVAVLALAACDSGSDAASPPPATDVAADVAADPPDAPAPVSPPPPVAQSLEEVVDNESCGINAPQPGVAYPRAANFPVWGYAFDTASGSIPAEVSVRFTALDSGRTAVFAAARGSRPDVAETLRRPELVASGFGAEVDVTSFEPGSYVVSILQQSGGILLVCNNPLPITLN